jgi:hypothetical protein
MIVYKIYMDMQEEKQSESWKRKTFFLVRKEAFRNFILIRYIKTHILTLKN